MKTKFLRLLSCALLSTVFVMSCNPEEQEITSFKVEPEKLAFTEEGGELTISVSAVARWNATSTSRWCTINPEDGKAGTTNITVSVEANTAATARKSTITVTSLDESFKVVVNQDAASNPVIPEDAEMEGSGTKDDPYLVANGTQMTKIKSKCKPVTSDDAEPTYFKVIADINMANVTKWKPINTEAPFALKVDFNGNGKTISNFRCVGEQYSSIFGVLFGRVYDLKIADAVVEGTSATGIVGGYAGTASTFQHSATVTNVHATGKVTGNSVDGVGGLFGRMCHTTIERCSMVGDVTCAGGGQIGGIVGYTDSGVNTIRNCYSAGTVECPTKSQRCAGIVGCMRVKDATVENCISLCTVSTNISASGIVGHANENTSGVKTPGDVVKNCIAWNPSISVLETRLDQYSSGAVVGFTSLTNTLSNCWRRRDMVFTMNHNQEDHTKYPLDFISVCDQEDASASSPLSGGVNYDPSNSSYVAPYHGKVAAEGETATQIAQRIGWSADIWDFSGSVPVLVGSEVVGVGGGGGQEDEEYVIPGDDIPNHNPVTPSLDKGWTKTQVEDGIVLWSFEAYDNCTAAYQSVHVADIDLNKGYALKYYFNADQPVTSEVMKKFNAIVAMNGGLGATQIFIKTDGIVHRAIQQDKNAETGVPNWRNDGAICTTADGQVFIANAIFSQDGDGQSEYGKMVPEQRTFYLMTLKDMPNIISGSPLLIDGYNQLGLTYVPAGVNPQTYKNDTEHPWYHQGVRHPRTAIAITGDNHLIMFVVDGRLTNCSGMSAKDLTKFLVENFDPKYALNLDGGGSSTLCVQGNGDPDTHVVNYPCDNGKRDHAGERHVQSFLYIVKK